ncbi:hypothetical protein DV711_09830 [Motiliproteus coralliicola]|uniref:Uncharacterized protein n=2 Tax=Motiliproteus coralliicola TaxID=2283196 RepID=A0A369WNQ7_9GAMM|nr:hypothetical protein DV711_09830 [Motiliproteus coralliicola]
MHRIILLILISVLVISCTRNEQGLPPGLRGGGFKISNLQEHQFVLDGMSELSIPYEIGKDGMVNFMQNDKAAVLGLIRKARYGQQLRSNVFESTIVFDQQHFELLKAAFEAENIPYRDETLQGARRVEWVQTYGPQVDLIIQQVGFERAKGYN